MSRAGAAALSTLLGPCSLSVTISAVSTIAAMIRPTLMSTVGARPATRRPSVTQLSAVSASAAASPPSWPSNTQASANSGIAASA